MFKINTLPSAHDTNSTHQARIFYKLVLGSIIIISVLLIFECFFLPQNIKRWIFILTAFNLISIGLIYLNNKGFTRTASYIYVSFLFILIFGLSWSAGGIKSPSIEMIPIVILAIGLVLGWKEGILIALGSILVCIVLVVIDYSGFLPVSKVETNSLSILINFIMRIGILALLQYLIVANLHKSFQETQQELILRRNSEFRLQSISNNFTGGMIYQVIIQPDSKRKFTYLSDSVKQLYGISSEEGKSDANLIYNKVSEEDIDQLIKAEDEAVKTLSTFCIEARVKNPSGEMRWSSFVSTPVLLEDGSICFDGIELIITERKITEAALMKSEEKFSKVFKTSPEAISITTLKEGKYIDVNDLFLKTTGYYRDEVIGRTSGELEIWLNKNDRLNFIEELTGKGFLRNYETCFRMRSGEIRNFTISSEIIELDGEQCTFSFFLDTTENKITERELEKHRYHLENLVSKRTEDLDSTIEELHSTNEELYRQKEELETTIDALNKTQNQLIQSEKMASLGILSAGIAHEINNPLNFIHGGVLGIEKYFRKNIEEHFNKVSPLINAINTGVDRASEIVSSLNHYSRQDDLQKRDCDVHSILDNCLVMLQNQLKNRIETIKNYTPRFHLIYGNEGKLYQALLNILVNAEQSIAKNGTIKIETEIENTNVCIVISDTGCGISQENLQKIIIPFYTTKAPGKGTGLGLSIAYNIICEHDGTIEFESALETGTKAIIKFPVITRY
jgi:PAS domain S-box-containing protein